MATTAAAVTEAAGLVIVTPAGCGALRGPMPDFRARGGGFRCQFLPNGRASAPTCSDAIVAASRPVDHWCLGLRVGRDGQLGANCQLGCDRRGFWIVSVRRHHDRHLPTRVAASDTGIIETWRETSSSAVMWLYRMRHRQGLLPAHGCFRSGSWRQVYLPRPAAPPNDLAACRIIYSDHDQRAARASQELATNDVMVAGYGFSASDRQNVKP